MLGWRALRLPSWTRLYRARATFATPLSLGGKTRDAVSWIQACPARGRMLLPWWRRPYPKLSVVPFSPSGRPPGVRRPSRPSSSAARSALRTRRARASSLALSCTRPTNAPCARAGRLLQPTFIPLGPRTRRRRRTLERRATRQRSSRLPRSAWWRYAQVHHPEAPPNGAPPMSATQASTGWPRRRVATQSRGRNVMRRVLHVPILPQWSPPAQGQ